MHQYANSSYDLPSAGAAAKRRSYCFKMKIFSMVVDVCTLYDKLGLRRNIAGPFRVKSPSLQAWHCCIISHHILYKNPYYLQTNYFFHSCRLQPRFYVTNRQDHRMQSCWLKKLLYKNLHSPLFYVQIKKCSLSPT